MTVVKNLKQPKSLIMANRLSQYSVTSLLQKLRSLLKLTFIKEKKSMDMKKCPQNIVKGKRRYQLP